MTVIVYKEKDNKEYLEKVCYMSKEEAQEVCDKLNEERNTTKYYVKTTNKYY